MKRFLILTVWVMALTNSYAQWTADTDVNTLVANSAADDMKALGTSTGMTYVVFWKPVAAPTNYELRMQVLDFGGNRTLGEDGMLVSSSIPMSTFTVIWNIVLDADDNIYIGVTGTGGGDPAYVFKLDSSGNHLWNSNGVNIGSGNLVTILPKSDGGAIVSWLGASGGLMQRLDADGNQVWPNDQELEPGIGVTAPANLFELSNGGYVVVFHELLTGINSYLHAQRFDGDGNPIWASAVQISNQATAFNRSYEGIQVGDVVYMGYFGSTGVRFDSFLQRINPDGTLPWGINGSDFDTNQTDYEMGTTVAFETGSNEIWALCTYTNPSQSDQGERVQKFNKETGARLLGDAAHEVYPIGSWKVHAGSFFLKDGSPLFLMRSGESNGVNPESLHSVYLDANGDFAWPEESRPVATFEAAKSRIQYTQPVNNQSVAVFVENKGAGSKIYAQNSLDEELGITDLHNNSIRYTNPIRNFLHLEYSGEIQGVNIFNVLGQEIVSFQNLRSGTFQVATQNWGSGLYFVNVFTTEGKQHTFKILKQ